MQVARGKGDIPNPFIWESGDYQGNVIRITVTHLLNLITGITVYRDADCVYDKIFVGVGPDGSPNTSPHVFPIAAGTTILLQAQLDLLASEGIATIQQFLSLQITAGT